MTKEKLEPIRAVLPQSTFGERLLRMEAEDKAEKQKFLKSLKAFQSALAEATSEGLLDELLGRVKNHDSINIMCDTVDDLIEALKDESKDICPHCNSRNTEELDGLEEEYECYDCGKTYK